jgi:lysozyme family protein
MTFDEYVDQLFRSEGTTYGDPTTSPPIDQPTGAGGITLPVLKAYSAAQGIPLADPLKTLKQLTRVTATPIVRWKLLQDAKKNRFDEIVYEPLRWQMMDFAYNSGPSLAIRWLQRVLRVPRSGVMDAATFTALNASDPWLVNEALVGARLQMVDRWTDSDKRAKAWEEGVESRGLLFSQLQVP